MFRCDHPSGVAVMEPATPIRIRPFGGYFARGDSRLGTEGTIIDAEWLNMVQEELSNCVIINTPGVALDKSDRTQLLTMLRAISPGGPGTGTGGAQIQEPPNNLRFHSRWNPVGAPPAPPETGFWLPAIDEPPVNTEAYSRVREPGMADGRWVVATGRRRPDTSAGPAQFYVAKGGFDGDHATTPGDGTPLRPWATIQWAVDWIAETIDANGVGVDINVGPSAPLPPFIGFEVRQRVVGCPPGKFRIKATTADPLLHVIGGGYGAGDASTCCVYVNGGRVAISGFSYAQPQGYTPYTRGTAIKVEGSGSVCELDGPATFHALTGTQAHLWAALGGIIRIKSSYQISNNSGTAYPATLEKPQQTHLHASNAGMIIYDDTDINCNFVGQCMCITFALGETGGILRFTHSFTFNGGNQPPTIPAPPALPPMRKWYVSGNAVIDCLPQFVIYNNLNGASAPSPIPPPPHRVATEVVPGATPSSDNLPNRWSGGRVVSDNGFPGS
jgi:hypothetical protein